MPVAYIFSPQGREVSDTRRFLKQLVRELVTPHIQRRNATQCIQRHVRNKVECYLNSRVAVLEDEAVELREADHEAEPEVPMPLPQPQPAKRTRRCCFCVAAAPDRRLGSIYFSYGTPEYSHTTEMYCTITVKVSLC
jgi:hypothetical protein